MNVFYNVLHKCVESKKKKKNVNESNKNEKHKQD